MAHFMSYPSWTQVETQTKGERAGNEIIVQILGEYQTLYYTTKVVNLTLLKGFPHFTQSVRV